jgi:chaperonin GroES
VAEKQNAMTARVIAAGPGLWASDGRRVEMQVRVGDRVTFDAKLCTGVPFEGQMYWVINERDVIAVVRGLDPDGSAAS